MIALDGFPAFIHFRPYITYEYQENCKEVRERDTYMRLLLLGFTPRRLLVGKGGFGKTVQNSARLSESPLSRSAIDGAIYNEDVTPTTEH